MLPLLLLAGCAVGPNAAERFYRGVEIGRAARPPVAPVVVDPVSDRWLNIDGRLVYVSCEPASRLGTPSTVANWIRPKNASSARHK